ncbi:MAG: hypothetical protein FWE53_01110 [Firmicutes bacterium]|nr:hypothetical protein [Bacillota bacterium]
MFSDKQKRIAKGVLAGVLVLFMILAPVFLFPNLLKQPAPNGNVLAGGSFLMLWQVETQEAGSGSIGAFLERRAVEYEKANKGTFIVTKRLTLGQLVLQLENGYLPDLISFGLGAGEIIAPKLKEYTGASLVRPELAAAGRVGAKQMAVPWCMGGYMLAAKSGVLEDNQSVLEQALKTGSEQKNRIRYSLTLGGEHNVGLLGLLNTNSKASVVGATNALHPEHLLQTQYKAYADFVSLPQSNILLGSQRDYARLVNRERNGSMDPLRYEFLSGFSDIVNFMGVVSGDSAKQAAARKFIEYLTGGAVQALLPSIGMFSVDGRQYYTQDGYREFELALSTGLKTINVFTSSSRLNELRTLCLSVLMGQESARRALGGLL